MPGFDFKNFEGTPVQNLAKLVESQDTQKMTKLLQDGQITDIDYREPKHGLNLLVLSIVNKRPKSMKWLLEHGANPNLLNLRKEQSAMHWASGEMGCLDTFYLKLLIQHGGDVNSIKKIDTTYSSGARTYLIETPLSIAAGFGCMNTVAFLLNNGADPNQGTLEEETAVTDALIQDRLDIALYIMKHPKTKLKKYFFTRYVSTSNSELENITIRQFLMEENYEKEPEKNKLKQEILKFLETKGL
jgi:ankyrin repeat protein